MKTLERYCNGKTELQSTEESLDFVKVMAQVNKQIEAVKDKMPALELQKNTDSLISRMASNYHTRQASKNLDPTIFASFLQTPNARGSLTASRS